MVNNFQNPMYPNFMPQPQNFYGGMPPGINWQQEMTNRLNTLQNQIQNSFTNQNNASGNNINQGFLRGRIAGSKEEVLSAQVDFEPQFFPVGNEVIYVKKLGLDGKSQVLEYRLYFDEPVKEDNQEQVNFTNEFNILKSNYDELLNKYNMLFNDFKVIKNELGIEKENNYE